MTLLVFCVLSCDHRDLFDSLFFCYEDYIPLINTRITFILVLITGALLKILVNRSMPKTDNLQKIFYNYYSKYWELGGID